MDYSLLLGVKRSSFTICVPSRLVSRKKNEAAAEQPAAEDEGLVVAKTAAGMQAATAAAAQGSTGEDAAAAAPGCGADPFFRSDNFGIDACQVVGPGRYYLVGKSPLAVLLPSFQLACSLAHACLRALLLPNKRTE
jgi:hypothetical protein